MVRLSGWLTKISSGWLAGISVVVFILFMVFVLPGQAEKAAAYAGDAGSPDTSFFYTPDKLYQIAEIYGEEGRQAYVQARFTFDLLFPIVYGIFLITTISWLAKQSSLGNTRWYLFNLLPVAGVIFDLLENGMATLVMSAYPDRLAAAALLASIFTPMKWFFVYGSFFALIILLGYWVYRTIRTTN